LVENKFYNTSIKNLFSHYLGDVKMLDELEKYIISNCL
jgi:hypothetical protein